MRMTTSAPRFPLPSTITERDSTSDDESALDSAPQNAVLDVLANPSHTPLIPTLTSMAGALPIPLRCLWSLHYRFDETIPLVTPDPVASRVPAATVSCHGRRVRRRRHIYNAPARSLRASTEGIDESQGKSGPAQFNLSASKTLCRTFSHSLASHTFECCTIGTTWQHSHQHNPTALYRMGLPYEFDSPKRVSAFVINDGEFADDIALPTDASLFTGPHTASWQASLDKEHSAFDRLKVCDLILRLLVPNDVRILRMRCVWKVKCSQEDLAVRFKSCRVVYGQYMVEGIHYFQSWAPTARALSIKILLTIAGVLGLKLVSYEIFSAFFGIRIDEDISVYPG